MSDMFSLGPLSNKDLEIYRQDFVRGSKVMKEAAEEYSVTSEPHKKEQLKKAMGESLEAMNEIINNVLHEKGERFEKKLTADYQSFINNSNTENMQQLNDDLKNIEKKI